MRADRPRLEAVLSCACIPCLLILSLGYATTMVLSRSLALIFPALFAGPLHRGFGTGMGPGSS